MRNDNLPDIFIKLSEGYSKQNKTQSIYWITLALFSIFVIAPYQTNGNVKLPIIDLEINLVGFYSFSFLIVSILIICFGSSSAQLMRTRMMIDNYIKNTQNNYYNNIHIKDLFDAITESNIARVAPIPQLLLGKNQFFTRHGNSSPTNKIVACIYYIILRLITFIIIEFFPGCALFIAFTNIINKPKNGFIDNIPIIVFIFLGVVAVVVLFQILIFDIIFAKKAVERILGKE